MPEPTVNWLLKRQDDHGNQYTIERFDTEEKAIKEMQRFQNRGHKQTYWVEREEG